VIDSIALRHQAGEAADLVGRLRHQLPDGANYTGYLLDQLAGCVEIIAQLVYPTAAEMYAANMFFCGDEDVAVEAALEDVDRRVQDLRRRLGTSTS
jgi:hypothetical protein